MPLQIFPQSGTVLHQGLPSYHATPVPSRRQVTSAWRVLNSSLSEKQKQELSETLNTLRTVLGVER